MRIGQLTFHASHNYGSVLQAYALMQYLHNMGYDSEYINLRPEAQKDTYRVINRKGIHKLYLLLHYNQLRRRYNEFERFIDSRLLTDRTVYHTGEEIRKAELHYDAFICGGDQIWNPACQDFDTAYYLQFLSKKYDTRKISYSPSFGKNEFDIQTIDEIRKWIADFDFISVREITGKRILQELTEKPVHVVCDPVLLLSKEEWAEMAIKSKYSEPYILVYFLENNHGSRTLVDYLRQTLKYDVVVLNEYIRDIIKPYHKAYAASPEEFIGLIMNASFVYTNSFHGTLFATLFEKPFLTAIAADQEFTQNNNDSRKIDYLRRIGMGDRLYASGRPNKSFLLDINFSESRKKIAQFKAESTEYLRDALR